MLQGRESLLLGSFFHFPEGQNNSESEGCIYKVIQPRTSACLDAKYGSSPRENTPVLWLGVSQAMPGSCTYRLRRCLTPNPPRTRGDGDEEGRARRGLSSLIATAATKSKSIRDLPLLPMRSAFPPIHAAASFKAAFSHTDY